MAEMYTDAWFMQQAIKEAEYAASINEVPVGAVIVCNNTIIARAHNLTERLLDFTAHAEMQAFTAASEHLSNKYLNECTLYVTLEPCVMCAGASFWTRIGRLVYGASDEKHGAMREGRNIYHPSTQITGGVLQEECSSILTRFFRNKRAAE
jgi:tRNA(adenine34) deaminase